MNSNCFMCLCVSVNLLARSSKSYIIASHSWLSDYYLSTHNMIVFLELPVFLMVNGKSVF